MIADGVDPGAPTRVAMTAPAWTVAADRLGGEVLLDMLDRGVRHVPVLAATGEVLGVLSDLDVVAATTRSSFALRAAIARAGSVPELVTAAAGIAPALIALHDARVAAADIAGIHSVVIDALTRRLIELVAPGPPPRPLTWLALGSVARREAVPSSDVDSALAWAGPEGDAEPPGTRESWPCGCSTGWPRPVSAPTPTARWPPTRSSPGPSEAWTVAHPQLAGRPAAGEGADPGLAGGRRASGVGPAGRGRDGHRGARRLPRGPPPPRPAAAARPLRAGPPPAHRLPARLPRGVLRAPAGHLDLKRGGLVPIVDLARWAGMAAGVASASTPARLRAAAAAGTLDADAAATLEEAFHLVLGLRLGHQIEQLAAGQPPDDLVRPRDLSAVTRASLREAFRAVAAVQRQITAELDLGAR